MKGNIVISKLDAARRQLEMVIRIYFSNGDPVAIHTLTAAAYNIIRDLNSKHGGTPMMVKDMVKGLIKSEFQKNIMDRINKAENFFKHADKDHESTLDFNPSFSEVLIYDACTQYHKLTKEFPPLFKIYNSWFMINNSDLFILQEEQKQFIASSKSLSELGRHEYFDMMMPFIMKGAIK